MSKPGAKLPYEDTKIAVLLRKRIDELKGVKSQRDIASEIGYDKPNIISMYKRGEAKVPLDRIPEFARALEVDPAYLFRIGMEQWGAGKEKAIATIFGQITTKNNRDWLDMIVEISGEEDPELTPERAQALRKVFAQH